jgi:hypothetical protein
VADVRHALAADRADGEVDVLQAEAVRGDLLQREALRGELLQRELARLVAVSAGAPEAYFTVIRPMGKLGKSLISAVVLGPRLLFDVAGDIGVTRDAPDYALRFTPHTALAVALSAARAFRFDDWLPLHG